ncbi:MAG: hypothetical protein WCO84_00275 [bacterium]
MDNINNLPVPARFQKEKIERIEDMFKRRKNISVEIVKKAFQIKEFELVGKKIKIVGVSHHPLTLEIPEFRTEIENAIENSSSVVLEAAPSVDTEYTLDDLKKMLLSADLFSKEEADIMLPVYIKGWKEDPTEDFFKKIEDIVAKNKKRLTIVDPNLDSFKNIELKSGDASIKKVKFISELFVLGYGYLSLRDLTRIIKPIAQPNKQKNKKDKDVLVESEKKGITRREFLKLGAVTALGALGVGSLISDFSSTRREVSAESRDRDAFDHFLYNLVDYRDAVIADELDKLSRDSIDSKPIVLIYGSGHISGIHYYSLNPRERKLKIQLYRPFFEKEDDNTKSFLYDSLDKKWEKQVKPNKN